MGRCFCQSAALSCGQIGDELNSTERVRLAELFLYSVKRADSIGVATNIIKKWMLPSEGGKTINQNCI